MNEENLARFKQILSKLPEEKRKLLYERLHSLPQSEREAFISEFLKKYSERNKPHKASPSAKKTPDKKSSSNKPVSKAASPAKKEPVREKPKRATINKVQEPAPKKDNVHSFFLGILIALIIVGSLYFIYVFNKERIDGRFNEMFGMTETETSETSSGLEAIMGPEPKVFPTDTPTPVPSTPTPSPVPVEDDHPDLTGLVIVIDPGHQKDFDYDKEESIPGTNADKERGTPGATGIDSGNKEYELTLQYAIVMKEYLESCGAEVILTRESNDVSISNIERAEIAVDNNADYFIRLHADAAPDSDIRGVKVYVPSTGKYASSSSEEGKSLADTVADAIGSSSLGVIQSNMYTGLNHADSVKSFQLVIGYLSNSEDDALLGNEDTAYKVAVAVSEFLS